MRDGDTPIDSVDQYQGLIEHNESLLQRLRDEQANDNETFIRRSIGDIMDEQMLGSLSSISSFPSHVRRQLHDTLKFAVQYMPASKINELDKHDWAPVHTAVLYQRVDCLEFLLFKGADPDIRNPDGVTPIDTVNEASDRFYSKEMRAILDFWKLRKAIPSQQFSVKTLDGQGKFAGYSFTNINEFYATLEFGPFGKQTIDPTKTYWVHYPMTSGPTLLSIVRAINRSLEPEIQDLDPVKFFLDTFKRPGTRPDNPLLSYREPIFEVSSHFDEARGKLSCIVIPHFERETVETLRNREHKFNAIKDCLTGEDVISRDKLEICLSRTLDEAYFPSLDSRTLELNNEDQTISREFRRRNLGPEEETPVLMVPQLWLWKLDNVLLSASSSRQGSETFARAGRKSGSFVIDDYRDIHVWHLKQEFVPIDLQMGLIIADVIEGFGQKRNIKEMSKKRGEGKEYAFLAPLDMFESAIVGALQDVRAYVRSGVRTKLNIEKEESSIHNISDIRCELKMIETILKQQQAIVKKVLDNSFIDYRNIVRPTGGSPKEMKYTKKQQERHPEDSESCRAYSKLNQTEREGWETVKKARARIFEYLARIEKMDGDAERVEKTIESYLNLKRTHASVEEAHASIEVAQSSVIIGKAALGFAAITIIFTPLSFLAALFALPTKQLVLQQSEKIGDKDVFRDWYIGVTFAFGEIASLVGTAIVVWLGTRYFKKWESRKVSKEVKSLETPDAITDEELNETKYVSIGRIKFRGQAKEKEDQSNC